MENKATTDLILINASEELADNIVAIEKFEAFNNVEEKSAQIASVDNVVEEETEGAVEELVVEEVVEENNDEQIEEEKVNENFADVDNEIENIDVIPEVLDKSIFKLDENIASYSEEKPIPTAEKLPEGLVFKVQVGAFRNPIPQNHFKGFAPILAEDAGNGITRYTAGLFRTYEVADEAKGAIRNIGYSDAFVVAFLNGERMNIYEARTLAKNVSEGAPVDFGSNNTIASSNDNESLSQETEVESETNDPGVQENQINNDEITSLNVEEETIDEVSTNVKSINGVFFTVQVGVFSKPITSGDLNNLTPINSERIRDGLIRYTSGVYKSLDEANDAKIKVVDKGITDAFIVAYNGGNRITVAEAQDLLGVTETTTTTNNAVEESEKEELVEEEKVIEEDIQEVESREESNTPSSIEYKVKLGEYEDDMPVDQAGIYLKLISRGVKIVKIGQKTIYLIGSFDDYQSALDMQIEMQELGVAEPVVIALKDGEEISVEEALILQKEK